MNITKSAPLPERPCEQLTYCAKNESEQWDYINCVKKRHNCRITGKEKATSHGGPSTQATRYPQRMSADYYAVITSGWQCDQCAGLLVGYSCSLAFRRWRRLISPSSAETINCPVLSPSSFKFSTASAIAWGTRASSFLDFPLTAFVAISDFLVIRWLTVYTQENRKTLLTWLTPVTSIVADTFVEVIDEKTKPAGATNTNGLLTTNDSKIIKVAMRNHNQTKPEFIYTFTALHRDRMADGATTVHVAADTLVDASRMVKEMGYVAAFWKGREENTLFIQKCENNFIWRFIALSTAQPRVITIEATSEQEARQQSPAGCVMVFAARIRQEVRHVQ